jgi:hypothetical protein
MAPFQFHVNKIENPGSGVVEIFRVRESKLWRITRKIERFWVNFRDRERCG